MPDRHFAIDGYLVAEAEIPCSQPRPDVGQCDRFLLFGDGRGWTLLTIHRITTWREGGPFNVRDTAGCVTTYYDLDTLRALHTESVWQALVEAAAGRSIDLENPAPPAGGPVMDAELIDPASCEVIGRG